jgi:hypothetical protein
MTNPSEEAARRQRDRQQRQDEIIAEFEGAIEDVKFPVHSAEIAAEYRDAPDEVVAEEESLSSVLDRLDEEYDDELSAREAVLEEFGATDHDEPADLERERIAEAERAATDVDDVEELEAEA